MDDPEILEKEKEKEFLKDKEFPEKAILWHLTDKFFDEIKDNQIIICQSPTGTGKSVILPYKLLYNDKFSFDRIFVSEPRQIAAEEPAKTVMNYKQNKLLRNGTKIRKIGYFHGDEKKNENADLLYITEGSLINKIKRNELETDKSYCFIIDEAHEKNKETEELLIYFKYLMNKGKWNENNKIIILSATMPVEWITKDTDDEQEIIVTVGNFSKKFTKTIITGNNPIQQFFDKETIYIDFKLSTTKPITEYYSLKPIKNYIATALELAKRAYENNEKVLIFVSGNNQINKMGEYIKNSPDWKSIHKNVYYVSSTQDDWKVKEGQPNKRKSIINNEQGIIISTPILETSITIHHLTTVIDTGSLRQSIYISELDLFTLPETNITELNRMQRRGRVGRKTPGKVYYLYTEDTKNSLREGTFSKLTVDDIINEVLKYKKNNELYELFKNSKICKKMNISITKSIEKLKSYNLLDEKENITNFGLNVIDKLENTKLKLQYICLLYYSIHNEKKYFNELLFIIIFIIYENNPKNDKEIFEELETSGNNIFEFILINYKLIWNIESIRKNFRYNYKKFLFTDFKGNLEISNDKKKECIHFIKKALYSVYNLNLAEFKSEDKSSKYKLPNKLEITDRYFYKYHRRRINKYHRPKEHVFQGLGSLTTKNVLYMNSFFADNISIKYCIDVTDVIEENKRLYLSFQMQINDRIKELKELINKTKYEEQTTAEEISKKQTYFKKFVEHKEKLNEFIKELNEFKDIDLIIIGGYAVKQYYNDHQTSDIDIKVYPKNNYDVNDLMTKIIEKYTISKNFNPNNPEEWKTKGRFIFDEEERVNSIHFNNYNYIKTDNKLTISKYDSEYGYIPLIDIVFEKTKDKGSYTIIDGLKYRNKYYLINEILENTKGKDETFEERLDKAIEDHKLLIKYKKELKDLESKQESSFNPEAQEWTPGSKSNVNLTSIEIKKEQIKVLQNLKENLYPDKVKSWIRQLENLRDQEVYTQLYPNENIVSPPTNERPGEQPGEGKVNLKVPLLKINQV